jgi:hypothetical protein
MNVPKEQAEEVARILNHGFTEADNDFLEAEVEVALGGGTPEQVALVREKLDKEPWRQAYFDALKESTHLFSPAAAEAQLTRISKIIGEDFRAVAETHTSRVEQVATSTFQGIAKGAEAVGGWIRLAAESWSVKFNLAGLQLVPAHQGTPSEQFKEVVLGENVEGIVDDDEITFAWSGARGFPSSGAAVLAIGGREFTSKIAPDGFGGGSTSFDRESVAECAKAAASATATQEASLTIKSEEAE